MSSRTVFILSASSDIGRALTDRYLSTGATVIGTYRSACALDEYRGHPHMHILPLDLAQPERFPEIAKYLHDRGLQWDLFVASNGTMEPIGPFLEVDGESWQDAVCANALAPCRLVQVLYPLRRPSQINSVAFFAGALR